MASKTPQKQQQREHAKLLYTTGDLTQNEIALRVGVNNKTIGAWVKEGLWDSLRKSLITSKSDQIRTLYEFLDKLNDKIRESDYSDAKMANTMKDYTTSIKNLETEMSVGMYFETGMKFIRYISKSDMSLAKQITKAFDAFIIEELNNKF